MYQSDAEKIDRARISEYNYRIKARFGPPREYILMSADGSTSERIVWPPLLDDLEYVDAGK